MEVKRFSNRGDEENHDDKLLKLNMLMLTRDVSDDVKTALVIMMSVKQASEIIHTRLDPIMNGECYTSRKCLVGEDLLCG